VIALRELTRDDIPQINEWRRDRDLLNGLAAPFRHIGPEIDQAWYDRYMTQRDREVRCAICEPDGQMIGVVSLTAIDPVNRQAELHIMIGKSTARGRGAGTHATRAMLQHAFRDLNLHRVYLSVLESNAAARHMYDKIGFRVEGTLRDAAFKNGSYSNLIVMGILQSEFA
jgi:RimJ/RimL family protein N-acetyltransferase